VRQPPSLIHIPRYPVTGGVALLSGAVFILAMTGRDVSWAWPIAPLMWSQPWRFVTTIFLHGSIFHLLFNLYWAWALGTLIEEVWGPERLIGMIVLFAVGSGAAQFAVSVGGIGLSGVVYAFAAMLWALRWDRRVGHAVDQKTRNLFVVWFFVCIVLTATRILPIANTAHGVGAALGYCLGRAVDKPKQRPAWVAGLVAIVVVSLLAARYLRSYLPQWLPL
jgi:membrane associated rhomboid family serine protease